MTVHFSEMYGKV